MSNVSLGQAGESQAVQYLQRSGYRVVARNVRARFGEIDVVAWDGRALCFVEVKSRTSRRFGLPEEALTAWKRQRLIRLAQWYLQRHAALKPARVRFDVLALLARDGGPPQVRLIKGAFEVT